MQTQQHIGYCEQRKHYYKQNEKKRKQPRIHNNKPIDIY